jgi:hypothetical protein
MDHYGGGDYGEDYGDGEATFEEDCDGFDDDRSDEHDDHDDDNDDDDDDEGHVTIAVPPGGLGPWNGWGVVPVEGWGGEARLLAVVGRRTLSTCGGTTQSFGRRPSTWGGSSADGEGESSPEASPESEGARWDFELVPLPLAPSSIAGNGTYVLDGGRGGNGTVWTWAGPRAGLWERRAAAKAAEVLLAAVLGSCLGDIDAVTGGRVISMEQSAPYVGHAMAHVSDVMADVWPQACLHTFGEGGCAPE